MCVRSRLGKEETSLPFQIHKGHRSEVSGGGRQLFLVKGMAGGEVMVRGLSSL